MKDDLARQFRVAKQMVDMHARLRDRYQRRALVLDIVILAGSVVFAATTFADEATFVDLGLAPSTSVNVLRIASVTLFIASVAALRVDWKGVARGHDDAVGRLAGLVSDYREWRLDDGSWPEDRGRLLHQRYSDVTNSAVAIPTRDFTRLKAKFLKAKEVSKVIDARPGYPHWLASLSVAVRAVRKE